MTGRGFAPPCFSKDVLCDVVGVTIRKASRLLRESGGSSKTAFAVCVVSNLVKHTRRQPENRESLSTVHAAQDVRPARVHVPRGRCYPWAVRREVAELLAEVELDRAWYDATGGGVTLSGGEPCTQPEFALNFLARCRQRRLHTALDTCGQASPLVFARLLDHADLVLYDLKHSDEAAHQALTGAGLVKIYTNLREAARRARAGDLKLWVRTPLVPGAAAEPAVLNSIGKFLRDELGEAVECWELCAFNPSCSVKYCRLDRPWGYSEFGLQTEAETADLLAVARAACGRGDIVRLQGIRRGPAMPDRNRTEAVFS